MRRWLFDFYHRHLARGAAHVPEWLRAAGAGLLFALTRHPDFGFYHARSLVARGRAGRAARLYGQGEPVADPLFDAGLAPDSLPPATHADPLPASGVLQAQIGYLGLRLACEIRQDQGGPTPERLDLRIGDTVLRSETLEFRGGAARVRFRVSRPVLDRFPREAVLSARLDDGRYLPVPGGGTGWRLRLPGGDGGIAADIARCGPLEKKGQLRPDAGELADRQAEYLALYTQLRSVFEREFERPLLILYGTLLGQVRSADFIPGDDDFDVGYPSRATMPPAVRAEAMGIMERLAELGFIVVLNEFGRPFRVRAPDGAAWCHLDNRPIFAPGDGHVWLHKHARLPLPLSDFEISERAFLRGTEVLRPQNAEAFLGAYYGPGWRVPDPGYSNSGAALPRAVRRGLAQLCLSPRQQRAMMARHPGRIVAVRWQPLYPLAGYAAQVGF